MDGGSFYGVCRSFFSLLPGEADHAHNVDNDDRYGNNIAEDGLHPVSDLQALAGIGFSQEVLPTPAVTLTAAEHDEGQGAQRQQVVGNNEVPQIQPLFILSLSFYIKVVALCQ